MENEAEHTRKRGKKTPQETRSLAVRGGGNTFRKGVGGWGGSKKKRGAAEKPAARDGKVREKKTVHQVGEKVGEQVAKQIGQPEPNSKPTEGGEDRKGAKGAQGVTQREGSTSKKPYRG